MVLIFSHLCEKLNIPPVAWVGCQGLGSSTQKHLKSTCPKSSGNEALQLVSEDPKGSTVRF